jgi:hypothetical protein
MSTKTRNSESCRVPIKNQLGTDVKPQYCKPFVGGLLLVSPTFEKLDHDVTPVAYYSAFVLIPSNGHFLKPGRWPFV